MIVSAVYAACIVVSELMGIKTVPLFTLFGKQYNGSVALLTLPIIFVINDAVAEVYGNKTVRALARVGIAIVIGLSIFTYLATSLPPSTRFALTESAYDTVFLSAFRITIASLCAFAAAELLDIAIFQHLRKRYQDRVWLRSQISNVISQFLDTVIFMSVAFYALDKDFSTNISFLWSIILPYWFLKSFMSTLEVPFLTPLIALLRKDPSYDRHTHKN